jgi:GcrA cell cycle regulator
MAVPQPIVDQIVALTQAGLSRALVADQLGVTRNVVCGLVHRLGIVPTAGATRIRKKPPRPPKSTALKSGTHRWRPRPTPVAPIVGVIRPPATLLELAEDGCHWPVNDGWGSGTLFCNCGRTGSGHPSYCRRHAARSVRPDPRRGIAAGPCPRSSVGLQSSVFLLE